MSCECVMVELSDSTKKPPARLVPGVVFGDGGWVSGGKSLLKKKMKGSDYRFLLLSLSLSLCGCRRVMLCVGSIVMLGR